MGDMVSGGMDMVTGSVAVSVGSLLFVIILPPNKVGKARGHRIGHGHRSWYRACRPIWMSWEAVDHRTGVLSIQEINQSLKTIEADLKQLQDSKGDVDHGIKYFAGADPGTDPDLQQTAE